MSNLSNIITEQPLANFAKVASHDLLKQYQFADYFIKLAKANDCEPQQVIDYLYSCKIGDLAPLVKSSYDLNKAIIDNGELFNKSAYFGPVLDGLSNAWNGVNGWIDGKVKEHANVIADKIPTAQSIVSEGANTLKNTFSGSMDNPLQWLGNNPMLGGILAAALGLGGGGLLGGSRGAALGGTILPLLALAPFMYNKFQQARQTQPQQTPPPPQPQQTAPQQPTAAPPPTQQPPTPPQPTQPPAPPQPPKPAPQQSFGPNQLTPPKPLGQ